MLAVTLDGGVMQTDALTSTDLAAAGAMLAVTLDGVMQTENTCHAVQQYDTQQVRRSRVVLSPVVHVDDEDRRDGDAGQCEDYSFEIARCHHMKVYRIVYCLHMQTYRIADYSALSNKWHANIQSSRVCVRSYQNSLELLHECTN